MCIKKNIQKIINEFLFFENWEERYEYLISLGKRLPKMSRNLRQKKYIINGCQSNVWLHAYMKNNKIFFHADSDALIPRGIAFLMLRIYSGQYPYEIIHTNPIFIYKIGFSSFLSANRTNGMESMLKYINRYAIYFK